MPHEIKVIITRDGTEICALIGEDLMMGLVGFGSTVSEALPSLANDVERSNGNDLIEL